MTMSNSKIASCYLKVGYHTEAKGGYDPGYKTGQVYFIMAVIWFDILQQEELLYK